MIAFDHQWLATHSEVMPDRRTRLRTSNDDLATIVSGSEVSRCSPRPGPSAGRTSLIHINVSVMLGRQRLSAAGEDASWKVEADAHASG